MFKVECYTEIKEFKNENWPDTFLIKPEIGQWVESKSGSILKILNIIHAANNFGVPLTKLQLTKVI